jgi:small neutral amino acid transporter SnatA (MarC family)
MDIIVRLCSFILLCIGVQIIWNGIPPACVVCRVTHWVKTNR